MFEPARLGLTSYLAVQYRSQQVAGSNSTSLHQVKSLIDVQEDTALRTFIGDRQNFEKGFWQDAAEALGTQVNRGLTMSAINFAKSCRLR